MNSPPGVWICVYSVGLGTAPIAVNIAVDTEPAHEFVGSCWAKRDVKSGQHTITVTATGATPQTIRKIVKVPPGDVGKVEVKLS